MAALIMVPTNRITPGAILAGTMIKAPTAASPSPQAFLGAQSAWGAGLNATAVRRSSDRNSAA